MSVLIANASRNEQGKYAGGIPGDQDGKEVCIREWYPRPWTHIIRAKSPEMRKKIAEAMKKAAENNLIGYSQNQRNTLLTLSRKVGYDPSKVTKPCNTDCSALVGVACCYAEIPESYVYQGGNSFTTRTMRKRLDSTGLFVVYTDKEFTAKSGKLLVGDILLAEGKHTAVCVKSDVITVDTKSVTEIAREVIAGKWSSGAARRMRLMAAGYNYDAVQTEVNRLLKEG